jgi:hypothetical protein
MVPQRFGTLVDVLFHQVHELVEPVNLSMPRKKVTAQMSEMPTVERKMGTSTFIANELSGNRYNVRSNCNLQSNSQYEETEPKLPRIVGLEGQEGYAGQ